MARVSIQFAGTSIQTANIITQEIEHESIDGKSLDIQGLASRDGGKLLSASFQPRKIVLRGYIKSTTQALMETAIDDFKELLNSTTKNLDIGYAGGTRRYVCDVSRLTLLRQHYNITFAEWEAEFICARTPFGKALDTSTLSYSHSSLATAYESFVATGTYKPRPRIKITFTQANTITDVRIRNTTTGDWIQVTKATEFNANDVVIVDCDAYTVTINGTTNDYTGFFPQFESAGNDMRIAVGTGNNYKMTVKIIFYPLFL